jgi:hypothetical protein
MHAPASSSPAPRDSLSDVIDLYKRDVDASLLASRLAMTPEERLLDVMRMQRTVQELRRAGKAARESGR